MTCLKSEAKLSWQWFNYSELSVKDLHDLLAIRQLVFIVEQASIYLDADAFDKNSQHLCVRDVFSDVEGINTIDPIIAYARLIPPKIKAQEVILGRILKKKLPR